MEKTTFTPYLGRIDIEGHNLHSICDEIFGTAAGRGLHRIVPKRKGLSQGTPGKSG